MLPQILEHKPDGSPIRVWSAGCATGEEAYTVAIILAEALGEVRLEAHNRRGQPVRCEVMFTQLRSHLDELQGAILVMTVERAEV